MRLAEMAVIPRAFKWYSLPTDQQYTGDNLSLYHQIATIGERSAYARTVAALLQDVRGQVLEIGAGTGLISKPLADRHGDRLLCTDISPNTLELNPHTNKQVADCCKLPIEQGSVEAVVGVGIYRYMRGETINQFWAEMNRVIAIGGQLVLGEFHPRFSVMCGSKLEDARPKEQFKRITTLDVPANAKLGGMAMRIGEYRTYVFRH